MGGFAIAVILILLVATAVLVVLTIRSNEENFKMAQQQRLTPFSANIDPTTGNAKPFNDVNGNPQISCPAGSTVNIVAAFYNIFDPYNECSLQESQASPLLTYICDPTKQSSGACSSTSQCPYFVNGVDDGLLPFYCNSGHCQLQNLPEGSACPPGLTLTEIPTGSGQYFCVDPNLCGYNIDLVNNGGSAVLPNPYCTPSNTQSMCAMRDASASVAAKCNGRQSCPDLTATDFGDQPCTGLTVPSTGCFSFGESGISWLQGGGTDLRTGYCGLPFVPGYQGGPPALPGGGTGGTPDPANANLGYVMHGIYTCVPNPT